MLLPFQGDFVGATITQGVALGLELIALSGRMGSSSCVTLAHGFK